MKMKYKYQLLLIIIAIAIVFTIGTSYAIWTLSLKQEGTNVVKTDCFELTFTDQDAINLNNAYPITDNEASNLVPYQFTIKNICTYTADYIVNLEAIDNPSLSPEYLKVRIDNYDPFLLSSADVYDEKVVATASESRTIASGTLIKNEEITHQVRLWLDENATTDNSSDKEYIGKVVVIATVNKNNHAIALNTNGATISQNRILTRVGKKLGDLPTPTKEGSRFLGWYSDSTFTTSVDENTTVTDELTNLYAKWKTQLDFATYLRGLDESTTVLPDDGTDDHNMRYTGTTPNNYVKFALNDGTTATWRVIGVFNSNSHGSTGDRVKIMWLNNSSSRYDSDNVNDWSTSSLNEMFNVDPYDIYKIVGNTLIDDAVWKLGGYSTSDGVLTSDFYTYERGTQVYTGHSSQWTGKIALPYQSDFGYSIENGSNRVMCLAKDMKSWSEEGYKDVCFASSWMFDANSSFWTLTPNSSNNNGVFLISSWQLLYYSAIDYGRIVQPTVYLKSGIMCNNCDETNAGTIDNPFELSLPE